MPGPSASPPLAYFITFRCYGTWLHGDARGSTNRWRNRTGTPFLESRPALEMAERRLMKQAPFVLGSEARAAVSDAIAAECAYYGWRVHALNVRTNHVHVVATADHSPERVMGMLKAAGTRELRRLGLAGTDDRVWSRHGSTRYLWTEQDVASACTYVVDGQGADLD